MRLTHGQLNDLGLERQVHWLKVRRRRKLIHHRSVFRHCEHTYVKSNQIHRRRSDSPVQRVVITGSEVTAVFDAAGIRYELDEIRHYLD